jgi:hypothetical protein
MTTIEQLTETLNSIVEEAECDIEQLEQCIECLHSQIAEKHNWILWNRGRIDTAEEMLAEIEDGEKAAISESNPVHDNDLRTRLAAALHDHTVKWMKIAAERPEINRDFVDKPFDELAAIDRLAPLRDADTILDVVRGE